MGHPPRTGGWGTAVPSPLSPPTPPPDLRATGAPALHPPRGRGDVPNPLEGTATPEGGRSWTRTPRAPAPPTACSRGGRDRRANPHQRTRTTHRPPPGGARDNEPEQYGGRAPHDLSVANDARIVARPGRAEAERPPGPPAPRPALRGGRLTGRPSPPPPRQAGPLAAGRTRRPGLPHDLDRTRTPGGDAPATKGGRGRGPQTASPQRGEVGATVRPPPVPPPPPPTRKPRGRRPPTPPEAEGMIPPPPGRTAAPGREAGAGPASTPQPPAAAGTAMDKRTRASAQGRHTDRARGQQAGTNRSGMGATPSMARATPRTPALLPAQGR